MPASEDPRGTRWRSKSNVHRFRIRCFAAIGDAGAAVPALLGEGVPSAREERSIAAAAAAAGGGEDSTGSEGLVVD